MIQICFEHYPNQNRIQNETVAKNLLPYSSRWLPQCLPILSRNIVTKTICRAESAQHAQFIAAIQNQFTDKFLILYMKQSEFLTKFSANVKANVNVKKTMKFLLLNLVKSLSLEGQNLQHTVVMS
jgi:hypothetical protein